MSEKDVNELELELLEDLEETIQEQLKAYKDTLKQEPVENKHELSELSPFQIINQETIEMENVQHTTACISYGQVHVIYDFIDLCTPYSIPQLGEYDFFDLCT